MGVSINGLVRGVRAFSRELTNNWNGAAPRRLSLGVALGGGFARGIAETLMIAYGYPRETIDVLVLAGLATVAPDVAQIGGQMIEVELVTITDAGRRALKG